MVLAEQSLFGDGGKTEKSEICDPCHATVQTPSACCEAMVLVVITRPTGQSVRHNEVHSWFRYGCLSHAFPPFLLGTPSMHFHGSGGSAPLHPRTIQVILRLNGLEFGGSAPLLCGKKLLQLTLSQKTSWHTSPKRLGSSAI